MNTQQEIKKLGLKEGMTIKAGVELRIVRINKTRTTFRRVDGKSSRRYNVNKMTTQQIKNEDVISALTENRWRILK